MALSYSDSVSQLIIQIITVNDEGEQCNQAFLSQGSKPKFGNQACNRNKSGDRKCYVCEKAGHIARNCFFNPESSNYKGTNYGKKYLNTQKIKKKPNGEKDFAMISQGQVLITEGKGNRSGSWMIDSGCTAHICNKRSFFKCFVSEKGDVQVGKKSLLSAEGYGLV